MTEINDPTSDVELESTPESTSSPWARRGLLTAAAGGVAAAVAVATTQSSGGPSIRSDAASPPAAAAPTAGRARRRRTRRQPAPSEGDLAIANVAASLEVLAVNTYQAALDAAQGGALGDVPPAVAEFATTVRGHHQAALDRWNAVLTGAGQQAVTAPPAQLESAVNRQFGAVTDVNGVAQLALTLEQIAAATYLDALGKLESEAAITLAGSIQPIDRQHIAVLLFVLGMYPVPETFATVEMAFDGGPMDLPAMPPTR
jgi:Ferritin-like domain